MLSVEMRHGFETEVLIYMATIRKRPNGTYEIKVSCGYGVDGKQRNQYKSYKPEPGMTPRQIEKEVQRHNTFRGGLQARTDNCGSQV